MEPVAAGDVVADERLVGVSRPHVEARPLGVEIGERDVLGVEEDPAAGGAPRRDQVADDLVLAVDRDRPAAGEVREIEPVPLAAEREVEALVPESLGGEPAAQPGLAQQIDRRLLEDAGAHALDHVLLAADLDGDRLDAGALQQVAEQQPGRAGADDPDGDAVDGHGRRLRRARSASATPWPTPTHMVQRA